jgi:hypothetical protein
MGMYGRASNPVRPLACTIDLSGQSQPRSTREPRSEVNTNGDLDDRPDCRKLPPQDLDFLAFSCAEAMNRRF